MYGTKYGHDPRQLRPERCSSASRLSAASSLGPAATEHIFNSPSRCVAHHLEHWDFSRARSSAHQSFDGRSQSLLRKRGQRVCDVLSHDHRPGVIVAQPPLEPSQRACTSLCMHSPTSLGRLSPHPRPGVRVASSSDSWRAATRTPESPQASSPLQSGAPAFVGISSLRAKPLALRVAHELCHGQDVF